MLRAAGDPTRLRLLLLLRQAELTVSELIEIVGQSQPRVSRHLKLLGEAGFELLLSSHRLSPDVLIADGFRFEHPTASNAVRWAITD